MASQPHDSELLSVVPQQEERDTIVVNARTRLSLADIWRKSSAACLFVERLVFILDGLLVRNTAPGAQPRTPRQHYNAVCRRKLKLARRHCSPKQAYLRHRTSAPGRCTRRGGEGKKCSWVEQCCHQRVVHFAFFFRHEALSCCRCIPLDLSASSAATRIAGGRESLNE